MKALQVIESAYRCNIEEQDDPAVWISHSMKGAGADLDVLLRGNAVNYAITGQDASGLSFGDWQQSQPPQIERDVTSLVDKGVKVYVVEEDVSERGIDSGRLLEGIAPVSRAHIAGLFGSYDQIWHW